METSGMSSSTSELPSGTFYADSLEDFSSESSMANNSDLPYLDEEMYDIVEYLPHIRRADDYFQTGEFLAFSEPSFEILSRQEYLDCMRHHEEVIRYHKLFDRILGTLEECTESVRGRILHKTDTDVLITILKNWINEATRTYRKEDAKLGELDSDRKAELIAEAKMRTNDAISGFKKKIFILNERLLNLKKRHLYLNKELTDINFVVEFIEEEDNEQAFMEQLRSRVENAVENLNSTFMECVDGDQDALLQKRLDSSLINEDRDEEGDKVRAEAETESGIIFLLEESMQESGNEKIEWLPFFLEDFASQYQEVYRLIDKEESTVKKLSKLEVDLQKLFQDIELIDKEMAISELNYRNKVAELEKLQEELGRREKSKGIHQRLQAGAQDFKSKFKKWIN